MCGIAGIVSRALLQPYDLELVERMSRALIHRGPDGAGDHRTEHAALTMRRLSIIDPSTGWQPLFDEEGSLALVANGEIYNYVELRELLRSRGHVFRTGSDCETILHLYQEYGKRCVDHLRGMFAFALWDSRRKRLLLARDRMGEKPLYLFDRGGALVFGSELKTLLQSGAVHFELDPSAVDHYFHYQYVPEPMTPVRGIRKLPAGHVLTVDVDPWSIEEERYWRMEDAPPLEGDPATVIRDELETISAITIRSDVPVGIALSGGLDSSAIAVLAARKYPGTMHAFSVGYSGRPHTDERSEAKALADHLGMPFHEVELSAAEVTSTFPDVVRWQDEPIADWSGASYRAIARAARKQGVPVLLQGQGGDELFWGYPWVRRAARHSLRKGALAASQRPGLAEYLELSWPSLWPRRAPIDWITSLGGLRPSLRAYRRDRQGPRDRMVFYDSTEQFDLASRKGPRIYPKRFREALNGASPYDLFTMSRPWPNVEIAITRLICETYLLENGIAQGDRLSMASSIELRLPLVDYRLVETVIGLRKTQSDLHLPPKAWLRQAVAPVVPEWVLSRPKRGFQPPVRVWHRALLERHGRLLKDGALVQMGVLTPEAATEFSTASFPITRTVSSAYLALVLEVWSRAAMGSEANLTPH